MIEENNTVVKDKIVDNKWFLSAINGDLDYLKKHAFDNVGKSGDNDCTALMYSADCNRINCIDYLVMFEEELGKIDVNGNTALIYATKKNNIECVKILVKFESNIFNKDGKRAVDFAKESGFTECFSILNKFEIFDNSDDDTNATDNKNDDSNSERNLIKENKKLKKEFNIIKSANIEIERKIGTTKDRVM